VALAMACAGLGGLGGGADLGAPGFEQASLAGAARVNGHGWPVAGIVALVSAVAGLLWTLHATDAAQTARLDEIERRADVARRVLDEWHERLAKLEQDVALLKQRVEARP